MSGQTMDRAAAGRFVEAWCANWRKVDIDAVVSHFAENAEMRSPLALKLTESPVVAGAENAAPTGRGLTAVSRAQT